LESTLARVLLAMNVESDGICAVLERVKEKLLYVEKTRETQWK
jgi:hypothetical protein